MREETGLTLHSWRFRGIVTFQADGGPTEYMCLYTSDDFSGELISCDEGVLEWVKKEDIYQLNLWEGDRLFLERLAGEEPFFSMTLRYRQDKLIEASVDGKNLLG